MTTPSIEFYNSAVDAIQSGDLSEALTAAENSLTENPTDPVTWQLYAMVLGALGRKEDAAKATAKLKELGLSETDELLMQAADTAGAGDITTALSHYEAALALEQTRPEIHAGYALALSHIGREADAIAAAKKAVSIDSTDPRANYALGHVLRLAGDKNGALAALTNAVSAEPEMMLALYEQGMIFAENGRLKEALCNFEKFLETNPGDPSATEAVASIREQMET